MLKRLAFVHGFTQTSRSWGATRSQFPDYDTIAVDAPGHGDDHRGDVSLWEGAARIAAVVGRATYVGYSMGARFALHVALAHPDVTERLVLVSGTPGIRDEHEREARRSSDDTLADRIESIGVPRFIEEWLSLPMFSGLTPESASTHDRMRNTARGLADSLRHAGTGTQDSLWDRLGELTMPVLIICGDSDEKFRDIAIEMNQRIASSTLEIIPHCGHTVHLEQPTHFNETLRRWLSQTDEQAD